MISHDLFFCFFAFCLLPFVFCLLPFTFCFLPIAFYLLFFAYCLLPIAYCLLLVAYCLLPIAYCPRSFIVSVYSIPCNLTYCSNIIVFPSLISPLVIMSIALSIFISRTSIFSSSCSAPPPSLTFMDF